MRQEIKEKIQKTNQKYLRLYLKQDVPEHLEEQLNAIDWDCLELLKQNKTEEKVNCEPLAVMEIDDINAQRQKFQAAGLQAIAEGKIGAVLLAGGQGTRLGFDHAKG
ncbi:MAG: UDPGP type 1 family protein, partial [Lachnospiraceae bacterium]|nr:UDPGP type 1 family protein [Lachnospiraceae bacterium]